MILTMRLVKARIARNHLALYIILQRFSYHLHTFKNNKDFDFLEKNLIGENKLFYELLIFLEIVLLAQFFLLFWW